MLRKEITSSKLQVFFLSQNGSERNSSFFYLQRNGSERNSKFFLCYAEWLETEFRACSGLRKRSNSDGMSQNFRLFRVPRNFFSSENGNPRLHVEGSWCFISHVTACSRFLLSYFSSYCMLFLILLCLSWLQLHRFLLDLLAVPFSKDLRVPAQYEKN
jgi:hypothetical protein